MPELRQAARAVVQSPAFALTAALTIGLGIGANASVYAVVHAVLLEPLPFREPAQLVQVWESHPELHNLQVSVPDFFDWKNSITDLDLAAYSFQAIDKGTLSGGGDPISIQATNASSNLFPLLGIEPLFGHLYTRNDEKTKQPVVLISEQLWRRKFAAERRVVGRSIRIDAKSFTIAGVLPSKNAFPVWADIWMPLSRIDPELWTTRKYHPLEVIGRLKPAVSIANAELETEHIANRLSAEYPATNGKIGAFMVPLMQSVVGEVRPALLAAWIAAALVLFIACANLAHLMLGRALNRRREIALRIALGASRWMVFRTFLLEAAILSLAGALLGVLAANLVLPLIEHMAQHQMPRLNEVKLDLPVLLFSLAAALVTAALFALPSYLQVFRSDVNEAISSTTPRTSARQPLVSKLLMSSEVALSLAVLLAALLLVRSFALTLRTDPGFQPRSLFSIETPFVDRDWTKSEELFRSRVAPQLASIAGVREVAAVNSVPMSLGPTEQSRFATRFGIVGIPFEPGHFPTAQTRWSTANYFHALGIPLLQGRLLFDSDRKESRCLVNEAFAHRFFQKSGALGKKILLGVVSPRPVAVEIEGVVGDVREFGLTSEPEPTIYSLGFSPEMQVLVRTRTNDPATRSKIATVMRHMLPEQAVGPVTPLAVYVAQSLARQRFILVLIATFAGLAVCLCIIGIYGVFSYSVSRRMREYGIRAAVGAARSKLLRQVFTESLAAIIPGVAVGIAISTANARFLRTLLYRVSPKDASAALLAAALVLMFCLLSVAIPAWRAANVEPAGLLREE